MGRGCREAGWEWEIRRVLRWHPGQDDGALGLQSGSGGREKWRPLGSVLGAQEVGLRDDLDAGEESCSSGPEQCGRLETPSTRPPMELCVDGHKNLTEVTAKGYSKN